MYGAKNFGIYNESNIIYWKQSINILIDNIIDIQNKLNIKIKYINISGIGIPYYVKKIK